MNATPYEIDELQIKKDNDQRQLLSIFHYILGAFGCLGLMGIGAHYFMMNMMFSNPAMFRNPATGVPQGPPKEFFQLFIVIYLFTGSCVILGMLGNVLSAYFISKKKNRMFSLVVAGLNCMQFPFGTALGVFTFVVLMRESVKQSYLESEQI